MRDIYGVTFGNKHSFYDWGIYWNGQSNTPPTPQKTFVKVPFRNGLLDVTSALTDKIFFEKRTLTLDFIFDDIGKRTWPELRSEILGDIHGKTMHVTLDTDPDYYWDAYSCELGAPSDENGLEKFTVTCECFPYKLRKALTTRNILVNGSGIIHKFINSRMEVNPTFVTDAEVQMIWTDKYGSTVTVAMGAGTHTYSNIEFLEGENILRFNKLSSNANVTISYREGEL